jgi:hypothetical protein
MGNHEDSGPADGPPDGESNLAPIEASADYGARGPTDSEPPQVPSRNDVLDKLGRMPGLIAIGVLKPATANAMRSVYGTLLAHLDSGASSSAAIVADENLLAILRQQPELLKFIEPFLTPDQIGLILRKATE